MTVISDFTHRMRFLLGCGDLTRRSALLGLDLSKLGFLGTLVTFPFHCCDKLPDASHLGNEVFVLAALRVQPTTVGKEKQRWLGGGSVRQLAMLHPQSKQRTDGCRCSACFLIQSGNPCLWNCATHSQDRFSCLN